MKKVLAGILLMFAASSAQAVVVGNKDWHQVTTTTGYSWNDFYAIFDTNTGQCDAEPCLLGGSIDLTGYTWASSAEVVELWNSLTGRTASLPSPLNREELLVDFHFDQTIALTGTFDPTRIESDRDIIIGLARDADPRWATYLWIEERYSFSSWGTIFGRYGSWNPDLRREYIGGWVYKAAEVPTPAPLALLGFGALALGLSRKKRTTA